MKKQSRSALRVAVESVSSDRTPQPALFHGNRSVHAQLVRASSDWTELNACSTLAASPHSPEGAGVAAFFLADFLSWAIGPINGKRQINRAFFTLDLAIKDSRIAFADPAMFKLPRQRAMGLLSQGNDHEPAGFDIESVGCVRTGCPWPNARHPGLHRIVGILGSSGHRTQPWGFTMTTQLWPRARRVSRVRCDPGSVLMMGGLML